MLYLWVLWKIDFDNYHRNCTFFFIFYYVLLNELGNEPCPACLKPDHLARAAKRKRKGTRPKDPFGLDFELYQDHIPDVILKVDIKTWKAPHHPCNWPTIGTPKWGKKLVYRWYLSCINWPSRSLTKSSSTLITENGTTNPSKQRFFPFSLHIDLQEKEVVRNN